MSEETFHLSHSDSDEQKSGQREVHELRDDLKARTSELQLRRPSRRELRLQREANEAKAAAQSEKRTVQPDSSPVAAPAERQGSGRVHTFSLSSLERNTLLDKLEEEKSSRPAPAPQTTSQSESAAEESAKEKEPEDSPVSSGRSSLFDRFSEKNKDSISFRDRLVARTREGQLETREEQPVSPVESHDESDVLPDDATRVVEVVSDKTDMRPNLSAENDRRWPSLEVEDKVSETPVKEDTRALEENVKVAVAVVEESQPESVDDKSQIADEVDKKTEVVEIKGSAPAATPSDSSADPSEESSEMAAVVEAGRYPTDVTMRIGDDDEEKTTKDRLISALIILVGLLGGVILGLIAQKLIFGAEGSFLGPVETVQGCVLDYEVGAGLQPGL